MLLGLSSGDAVHDAAGVVLSFHQKLHYLLGAARWVQLVEQLAITAGID